jgi:hypothetical protein
MASNIFRRVVALISAAGAALGISARVAAAPIPKSEGGFLSQPLAEIQKDSFFTWFHLGETGRQPVASGGEQIVFQPTGEKFHALAIVTVVVNSQMAVQQMDLALKRSFISGGNGIFAADIAKSFLHGAPPHTDAEQMTTLANEVQAGASSSQTVIVGPGYQRPTVPDTPTASYEVYNGRRKSTSRTLTYCNFRIANEPSPAGDQVRMTFSLR